MDVKTFSMYSRSIPATEFFGQSYSERNTLREIGYPHGRVGANDIDRLAVYLRSFGYQRIVLTNRGQVVRVIDLTAAEAA